MPLQSLPYLLLLGFFFGTTLVVSRFSVGQFEATTYIWLRLALASLGHTAIFAISRRRSWPRDLVLWRRAALLGIFGPAVTMTALIVSLQFQSSGVTAILLTTGPAITAILAHFTLPDEKLNLRKIMGISLALGGAVFLAIRGESGLPEVTRGNPFGYILVLGALVVVGVAAIYTRKKLQPYDALDVASIRMIAASAVLTPFSLLTVGFDLSRVDTGGYLAVVWAGIFGTFGAFLLSFYIIQRFGATPSALVGYIIPIVASIGGVLLLDETITSSMLGSMALILVGITLLNERAPVAVKKVELKHL